MTSNNFLHVQITEEEYGKEAHVMLMMLQLGFNQSPNSSWAITICSLTKVKSHPGIPARPWWWPPETAAAAVETTKCKIMTVSFRVWGGLHPTSLWFIRPLLVTVPSKKKKAKTVFSNYWWSNSSLLMLRFVIGPRGFMIDFNLSDNCELLPPFPCNALP